MPKTTKALYRCVVDGGFLWKKYHLSGLLIYKKMEDSSQRIVFQNEMGFTFFDFEWLADGSFQVKQIIEKMDKPALVKTLRKDMELLLMNQLLPSEETNYVMGERLFHHFTIPTGGNVYYIEQGGALQSIENTGKSKVVTITLKGDGTTTFADSLAINHHKAHFTISLKKIPQDAH